MRASSDGTHRTNLLVVVLRWWNGRGVAIRCRRIALLWTQRLHNMLPQIPLLRSWRRRDEVLSLRNGSSAACDRVSALLWWGWIHGVCWHLGFGSWRCNVWRWWCNGWSLVCCCLLRCGLAGWCLAPAESWPCSGGVRCQCCWSGSNAILIWL